MGQLDTMPHFPTGSSQPLRHPTATSPSGPRELRFEPIRQPPAEASERYREVRYLIPYRNFVFGAKLVQTDPS